MGIFSRLGEIINANISSMLERAEDPIKMIRLMIHEMEDTLTEIKSSAAEVIADRIRIERRLREAKQNASEWEHRAELAISKEREDLAREAVERKLLHESQARDLEKKLASADELVKQYQEDISRLEEKLKGAYRRQKELADKMKHARQRKKVEEKIYQVNTAGAFARFEEYNDRIDRMEADTAVTKMSGGPDLEQKFRDLESESDVEAELARLKKKKKSK
ncbi:MAG: PspA/IM30 family protein [Acidobacteriota bacterium]|nr:PspA/IM30 family protein [Acidobacteriota bacterium]